MLTSHIGFLRKPSLKMNLSVHWRSVKSSRFIHDIKSYGTHPKVQVRDAIGPVNTVSNLHPIRFAVKENETSLETKLRECREDLQNWNQSFWTKQNKNYTQAKKQFERDLLKSKSSENQTITADEMSVFYKGFLDENWKTHYQYLWTWYKRNFYATFLHFNVLIQNIIRRRKA